MLIVKNSKTTLRSIVATVLIKSLYYIPTLNIFILRFSLFGVMLNINNVFISKLKKKGANLNRTTNIPAYKYYDRFLASQRIFSVWRWIQSGGWEIRCSGADNFQTLQWISNSECLQTTQLDLNKHGNINKCSSTETKFPIKQRMVKEHNNK